MTAPNWKHQTIWTGDNLPIMRGMNSESVDFIYLDPPFNSKANYAAPIGSKAAGAAFKDTWTLRDVDAEWVNLMEAKHPALHRVLLAAMTNSDKSYLAYMAVRLLEMHRLLKPRGSIWLHCDPTMGAYLKILMDAIFGRKQWLNEIAWKRSAAHNDAKQGMSRAGKVHDTLLVYGGKKGHTWNPQYTPYTEEYLESEYRHVADDGRRFKQTDLTAAKPGGDTSYDWRVKRLIRGRWEPDLSAEYRNPVNGWEYRAVPPYTGRYWAYSEDNLRRFWEEGRLFHRETGMPRLMQFADDMPGIPLQDIWDDISPALGSQRTSFRTQKPIALMRRIIEVASNSGDMVLDPFCGCATTLVAAEQLSRQWAGIDISPKAADLVEWRLLSQGEGNKDGEIGPVTVRIARRRDIPHRTDLGKIARYNSPANRKRLYGEQEGNCAGCAEHFESRHLEVDHIISRGKGGTDHIENLQLLCANCNRIKGDRGMEYLRVKLQL